MYDLFSRNRNFNHLETILNNEHVERIEIAMKETVDSKGWSEILTLNLCVTLLLKISLLIFEYIVSS